MKDEADSTYFLNSCKERLLDVCIRLAVIVGKNTKTFRIAHSGRWKVNYAYDLTYQTTGLLQNGTYEVTYEPTG